jgi:PAS domain-containing protein
MSARPEFARFLTELDSRRLRLESLAEKESGDVRKEVRAASGQLLAAREELRVQQQELEAAQAATFLTGADYDQAFAGTAIACLRTNSHGLIVEANRAARELLTWPLVSWSRRPLAVHFTLPTRPIVRSLISRARRYTGHVAGDAIIRRSLGTETPVRLAGVGNATTGTLRWAVMPLGTEPSET